MRIPLGVWGGAQREFSIRLPGKRGLTAKQLNEWLAYMNVEPFGSIWDDIRHAQVQALTHNLNRDSKTRPLPFTTDDFRNFKDHNEEKVVKVEDPQILSAQIRSKIFGM